MASPQLQAVITSPENFETLIDTLQSQDNTARNAAETVFDELKRMPDTCVQFLLNSMRTSKNTQNRMFCAIMLRKVLYFVNEGDSVVLYKALSQGVQATLCNEVLIALTSETEQSVGMKIADAIAEIGRLIYEEPGWAELMPVVTQCLSTPNTNMNIRGLHVLSELALHVAQSLVPQIDLIVSMLGTFLSKEDMGVQVAAVKVAASFIEVFEDASLLEKFAPLLSMMLQCLGALLSAGEESSAQEILEMFIIIAETHPRFLKRCLEPLVSAMLSVTNNAELEPGTRQLSAEFLVSLCEAREKAPGMMRKFPSFSNVLFAALLNFLLDIEDDPEWHRGDGLDSNEDAGEGDLYVAGQEYLDRVAISLGGTAVMGAASSVLSAWSRDEDWKKRHAVLICLAQIAEGCSKVMSQKVYLAMLATLCQQGLSDPVSKVRWAACQALGQMFTDLGPSLQSQEHTRLVPSLLNVMDDAQEPRVQAHACAAVVNFSESVEGDVLPLYLDTLIQKLLILLQHGQKIVQEGALTALASVADSSQELFVRYYDTVMPLLSHILRNAGAKEVRLLRAKALECISLVGMAVGKEKFRVDANEVMSYLQHLQQSEMDTDDPTMGYVLQAGARLCKCLGQEFFPYLAIVMPPLLKSAMLDPDVQVHDANDDLDDADDQDLEVVPVGNKLLCYRSSVLEEKATAISMLSCYADELKEGFLPYVQQVLSLCVSPTEPNVTPLLRFFLHEDIRRSAAQLLPSLLRSAVMGLEKNIPGVTAADVSAILNLIWPPLMEALGREPDEEITATLLDGVAEIVEMIPDAKVMVEQKWIEEAFNAFDTVLKKAEERRKERLSRQAAEDFDEEERAALEEENEVEEELFDQVASAIGAFLKRWNDDVLPLVEKILASRYAPLLLSTGTSEEERRIAICLVDDMLEHSPLARVKHFATVMPVLLEGAANSRHSDLRQCAVYGLGVLVSKAPELTRPYVPKIQELLTAIISAPNARDEDNEMATDNTVGCLGKLIEFHGEVLPENGAGLANMWIKCMPLKGDLLEAAVVHEQLVRFVEAGDNRLAPLVAEVLAVLVKVLAAGTKLIDGPVGLRAAQVANSLLPAHQANPVVSAVLAGLTPAENANLATYVSGSIPIDSSSNSAASSSSVAAAAASSNK
uniref:TOG domain-containing protein n=1 Tax=Polytomella parva TaxID=51329 RepID=A0A7S0VCH6_9CHLO|mmetsp:Transcript_32373/g.58800  ORF Transcript_32373/g.58800 Transcript_32373/m.58800 type:complete len:1151 (+) Transcript_32373:158-3610(+)|eukprot:CAMPEP_0175076386 /NCGR_PEP_ID=MMETSP0052_2-20121109/22693_1 /TAXON_ID=51329 ORGANISM="Polytomella parva, Strain SAG 63-3" /NCGR_SAMPLE_ID=MMETSP0052_2 /ASSEMBLY_ACC=CAM_ASM_000194 /LENGTH=1150 /DNA_ID=CAMNT_0016345509 /DNA_START=127 /DNA_END=3579 /DNA_ORIENTATION=-